MVLDIKIETPSLQSGLQLKDQEFNWTENWYPVCFVVDLPKNSPYGFSIYDQPFVMFRNGKGEIICLTDRCPHRAAKLSDGQITDGNIECLYHGWQFNSSGECVHIPQLSKDAKIPNNGCVKSFKVTEKQGMIWMWPGKPENAADDDIPTIPKLNQPGFVCNDKTSDLPCDIGYVMEHMLDPAHIHIAHSNNQGNRDKAQPLEMEIIESSIAGFKGRFRDTKLANDTWKNLDFIVPSLVHLHFPIREKGWFFGQAFFLFSLGKGRTRILTRSYRNFVTLPIKIMPRWWIHLKQNQILKEDLAILSGQEATVKRLGENIKEVYSPLPTCDTFVVAYRQWLDQFSGDLPFYQGYNTAKIGEIGEENYLPEKKVKHTDLCSSCSWAYQTMKKLEIILSGIAIASFTIAIITTANIKIIALIIALLATILAAYSHKLKMELASY